MNHAMNDATVNTAPVVRSVEVAAAPERAFAVFTEGIGAWWPLGTHSLAGDRCRDARFEDGLLVEVDDAGHRAVWGEVLVWQPPHRLSITFHPGREVGTRVDVEFTSAGEGTRVVLTHHGWEALGDRAAQIRAGYASDGGWTWVLNLFAATTGGGGLDHGLAGGLRARYLDLASALSECAAEASARLPDPGDKAWTPLWVAAHVVANDRIMADVLTQIAAGAAPDFPGHHAQSPELLARTAAEIAGDPAGAVRMSGAEVTALAAGLAPERLAARVVARIDHEGRTILDGEVSVADLVATQRDEHLPAHTAQVREATSPGAAR
jgi:uncharacterized protein YndB with AHSA1/START domain